MSVSLSDFYPFIEDDVQGAARPLIDTRLRYVIADFLRRTWVYLDWIDPIVTMDSVKDYELENPPGKVIIHPVKLEEDDELSSKRWTFNETTRTLWLSSDPGTGDTVQVMAALTVPRTTSAIYPDLLVDRFPEEIGMGVKARLMMMPGKPWTNPELAVLHRTEFEAKVAEIAAQMHRVIYGDDGIIGNTQRSYL